MASLEGALFSNNVGLLLSPFLESLVGVTHGPGGLGESRWGPAGPVFSSGMVIKRGFTLRLIISHSSDVSLKGISGIGIGTVSRSDVGGLGSLEGLLISNGLSGSFLTWNKSLISFS